MRGEKPRTEGTVDTEWLNTYYKVCGRYLFEKEDGLSLEISRAKALVKFPGSGAAQEAARKKMGLKSRQNRVNSFFLHL
jgi:hypothetical protein